MQTDNRNDIILLQLLRSLLQHASQAANVPLRAESNDADVVAAAMRIEEVRRNLPAFDDPGEVCRGLDRLLERSLEVEHRSAAQSGNAKSESTHCAERLSDELAAWIAKLRAACVHPIAIDIARLRVEGYHSRDVAERLGLGLRLCKRIMRDSISALQSAKAEG